MTELYRLLKPIDLALDQVLLDPNNPRFAELGESQGTSVPESRVGEPKVQSYAYERMKSPKFDVNELRDTIKAVGFLPMDRIVVRKIKGLHDKYLVIEGNRRVAALKWLIELQDQAKETFTDEQLHNFTHLPALLLDDERAPSYVGLVLPGLRHVSGIKQWGAYQQAKTVFTLRESGQSPQEAAQSLGLSTRVANQLWRSYLALEQMRADEEVGELVEARMYSYFEEIMKVPSLRTWLGWTDEERKFTNEDRVKELYIWMLGEAVNGDDPEERTEKKLPEAKSVRDLGKFIDDDIALAIFRSPSGTLERALQKHQSDQQPGWQVFISNATEVLGSISTMQLRSMEENDLHLLNQLRDRIDQLVHDRDVLLKN